MQHYQITANKTKHLLVENKLNQLKTFDSSYFIGKSHFEEEGAQNCLVFQRIFKYLKFIANTDYVSGWKSKGLSNESIRAISTSDDSLMPNLDYYDDFKVRVNFTESFLKQPKLSSRIKIQ